MDLLDLFWNLRQQYQIGTVTAKASTISADARTHEASLADLNTRFERLALVTQSVWELLSERAHVTEAELVAKMHEVDARDGARAGRASGPSRPCPKCGHVVAASRSTCLYCGASLSLSAPFSGI